MDELSRCIKEHPGETGVIACINESNNFVVNVCGGQASIPIEFCPFCGEWLDAESPDDNKEGDKKAGNYKFVVKIIRPEQVSDNEWQPFERAIIVKLTDEQQKMIKGEIGEHNPELGSFIADAILAYEFD